MNTQTITQPVPEWAKQAAYAVARRCGIYMQENLRVARGYEDEPMKDLDNNELAAIIYEKVPRVGIRPPRIGGTMGLKNVPKDEDAGLIITAASIKACLAPEHPKRTRDIADELGVSKEKVEEVIDEEGSGLQRGPGGWVKVTS